MTLTDQVAEIGNRIERTGIRIKEALSVIDVTFDDRLHASSPYEAFAGLNMLIDRTVHGARVERFRPRKGTSRFHTLEIHTEEGEILGYLNMLHLKRPLPCYYLVYVEVMPSFRGLGLGSRILSAFMGFLKDEGAVGLLDNIIPADEPAYEMYRHLGWRVLAEYMSNAISDQHATFMVFIPDSVRSSHLKEDFASVLVSLENSIHFRFRHDVGRDDHAVYAIFRKLVVQVKTLEACFVDEMDGTLRKLVPEIADQYGILRFHGYLVDDHLLRAHRKFPRSFRILESHKNFLASHDILL